jgi:hypothetical protein
VIEGSNLKAEFDQENYALVSLSKHMLEKKMFGICLPLNQKSSPTKKLIHVYVSDTNVEEDKELLMNRFCK